MKKNQTIDEKAIIAQSTYTKSPSINNLLITVLVGILAFTTGYLLSQVKTIQSTKTLGTTATAQLGTQQTAAQPTEVPVSIDKIKALFTDDNIRTGDPNNKLLFVEFLDPSCPYCHIAGGKNPELSKQSNFTYKDDGGTYVPPVAEMKKLVDEGKASMVTLYSTGHGNGKLAMEALYCANEQAKYWEAHDLLMTNEAYNVINDTIKNDRSKISDLVTFMSGATDVFQLTECLNGKKYEAKVANADTFAREYGVSGTPMFFVNTTAFRGAYSWTDMQSAVDSILKQ